MIYTLENEYLLVSIDDLGAELQSIKSKKDACEYMWQADKTYWGRRAPVMFPIIGIFKDDTYYYNDHAFNMQRHGFAKDSYFKVDKLKSNAISFVLSSNDETYKQYPFDFKLCIQYTLVERQINVKYKVINTGDRELPFSIGGHPGFNIPLTEDDNKEDYWIEFEKDEVVERMMTEDGFLYKNEPYLNNEKIIKVSDEIFKNDAIIFEGLKSDQVTIKTSKHHKGIRMTFEGFTHLGIWSLPGAKFICIEPWYGLPANKNKAQTLRERKGLINLSEKDSFECQYSVDLL